MNTWPPPSPVGTSTPPGGRPDFTDGEWHRLHPATPLLRGGIVVIVLLGFVANSLREQLLDSLLPSPGDGRSGPGAAARDDPLAFALAHGLIGIAVLATAVVVLALVAVFAASWRMNTFRITMETVEVRSGIIFRSQRRARLDRIQGITVQRPLLARIFGAARLEINQAGHDANLPLAYLRVSDSENVRREILRRASGASEVAAGESSAVAGRADPASVVTMPLGRLVGSTVLSGVTLILLALIAAIVASIELTGHYFLLVTFFPTLVGSIGYYSRRIVRSLRYSIASTSDGIRIGWGLIATSNETLPPGRIHAIALSQPVLWRPFGWWEVKIDRASHSRLKGADDKANTTILPVGSAADVVRVLGLILPELVGVMASGVARASSDRTLSLIEAGMTSTGGDGGFTTSPRRALVLRWLSWRRNGFRVAPGAILLRKGALWRQLIVVPLPRLQSAALHRGPVLRCLGLGAVSLHTVRGPIAARIGALDRRDAERLFAVASRDAVEAARADRTHRWRADATGSREAREPWPAPSAVERVIPADGVVL